MSRRALVTRFSSPVVLVALGMLARCSGASSSSPATDAGPTSDATTDATSSVDAASEDGSSPFMDASEDSGLEASPDAADAQPQCQPTCAHHPCGTSDGCNGTCAPAPADAGAGDDAGANQCIETAYFTVTFGDPLLGGVCATSSDRNSTSCSAGAVRYCQALGFGTGFPEQTITTAVGILCVAQPAVDLGNVPLATLTGFISTCTSSNLYSIDCEAASDDYCASLNQGYVAGFGPNEVDGSNVSVSCLPGSVATAITNVPIADFESPASTCCTANCDQGRNQGCDAESADYCGGIGYAGGFGPLQANTTDATVVCVLSN